MKKEDFISVLKSNTPQEMMDFLLKNGKKAKPFCPLIYLEGEELELAIANNNKELKERGLL